MGLAASQATLLFLTRRKADCEFGMMQANNQKLALTREMSNLSREYSSKINSKDLAFYDNGGYKKVNYDYLMGYGSDWTAVTDATRPLKNEPSMILTDYKGQVVLSSEYARAIASVVPDAFNEFGRGATFSTSNIAEILAQLIPGYTAENFQKIIDNKAVEYSFSGTLVNTPSGTPTGTAVIIDGSTELTEKYQAIVDFYYPIFAAAASNGFTTEYENAMRQNADYISDSIISGTLQLASVNHNGQYEEDTTLGFYTNAGYITTVTDSEAQQEINAWYEAEKARIAEKENYLDILISDFSTEHEAIKAEIDSVQSFIDDNINRTMSWGTSA